MKRMQLFMNIVSSYISSRFCTAFCRRLSPKYLYAELKTLVSKLRRDMLKGILIDGHARK